MEILQQILEKIRAYDRILIFRHKRLDGDCVGASKGLKAILQLTFPEKEILIPDTQVSNYLAFLGPDDGEIPEEKYADALGIVVDTATSDRISNPNFRLCKELIDVNRANIISAGEHFLGLAYEILLLLLGNFGEGRASGTF